MHLVNQMPLLIIYSSLASPIAWLYKLEAAASEIISS